VATKIKLVNYHIEELQKIDNLSERTKNVCTEESIDTLFRILSYYREHGTFRKLRNCGLKTDLELVTLSEKYLKLGGLSEEDLQMSEEDERFENLKLYCYSSFNVPSDVTAGYKEAFVNNRFPFFRFLQTILNHELNDREKFIFANNYGFMLSSKKQTLQSIGDQYSITRERVRQIAQNIPTKIEDAVRSLANKFPFLHTHLEYNIDLKKDMIILDEEISETINKRENLQFSPRFYGYVFGSLYNKHFFTFQDIDLNYKSFYLINRKYFDAFNFNAFFEDISTRRDKRIEQTYFLEFSKYLNDFSSTGNPVSDKVRGICKSIIAEEFDIRLEKGKIRFDRNTMIKLSEYILEILEAAGKPLKLKEICRELKNMTTKVPPNLESLRSSILSVEEIVAIGKTSTYALRKWDSIKTGTIKDLVKEFLEKYDEPKHIADITAFVNKFRRTSDKNIMSNLKLDPTGSFVFFRKSFIGLASKTYHSRSTKGSQLKLL
jgi:hypothetical protein